VKGIAGATILGDGSIVLILDAGGLVRAAAQQSALGKLETVARVERKDEEREKIFAMVVDDSITVRRVTQRLLERFGMRIITAKDGVDALALLQENLPDVMLLDIEMPRMDGYELASRMRADDRFKDIPIIMITSRTGEKHRNRAMEIGVNRYLGKPYQEAELIETIQTLVGRFNPERTRWD
jgi:chemosensory pili system protein ChpA (sensor histidine kinase/response regulator)